MPPAQRFRGRVAAGSGGRGVIAIPFWGFTLTPLLMRGTGTAVDSEVTVELAPEGPQRADLAGDVAAALDADPAAAAFFDTLAQFYRKAYLKWIDGAARRPELRQARIAEVVGLLAAGIKQRPR